jgi:hypothetical protein
MMLLTDSRRMNGWIDGWMGLLVCLLVRWFVGSMVRWLVGADNDDMQFWNKMNENKTQLRNRMGNGDERDRENNKVIHFFKIRN